MKHNVTLAALLLASTLSAPAPALTQEPPAAATPAAANTEEQIAKQAELERKAMSLLNEVLARRPH